MMTLTGVVFAIAFVMVQFSALLTHRGWLSCSPAARRFIIPQAFSSQRSSTRSWR
jgi:hypothetical protein